MLSERELMGAFGAEPGLPRAAQSDAAQPREDRPAALEELEREHIMEVLRKVSGNRMAAAKVLGISRRALYRRLERHNMVDEAPRSPFGRAHVGPAGER